MQKVNFRMDASAFVTGRANREDVEMAIIEKIEAMMRAVREGGMELADCMEIYYPFKVKYLCPHCRKPLKPSGLGQYDLMCTNCDEDFYSTECIEEE